MAVTIKSITAKVEQMTLLKAEIERLEEELKPVQAEYKELQEAVIDALKQANISMVRTDLATVTYRVDQVPTVEDWAAFDQYVIKHKATELFQKRMMVSAWRERVEAGEQIPGVEVYAKDVLTYRAAKAQPAPAAVAKAVGRGRK